jgi:hypothetical protein
LAKTIAIKPEETSARSYADRLILDQLTRMEAAVKLSELAERLSSSGIGLAAVRSLLASNPERFAYHERRWIPASRLEGRGKPLHQAMVLVLDRFGGPMDVDLFVQEVARIRGVEAAQIEGTVRRFLSNDATFALSQTGQVALTKWGFVANDEDVPRALALNGVSEEEFAEAKKKLAAIDWHSSAAVQEAVKAAAPIRIAALLAVAWEALNQPENPHATLVYDASALLGQAISVPGYVVGPDASIHPESEAKKWISNAVKLADKLAPQVDVDDAAPIELKAEDVSRLVARVESGDVSTTATKLLETLYEITPSNKTFPDDLANVVQALKGQPELVWVGGDRFRRAGSVPDFIHEVPEPFHFVRSTAVNEDGDLVDVELTDDGLSSSLRKLLAHPLAMDVLDEDIAPAPKNKPDSLRLVLKSVHRELGTFPLCQLPTGWLDTEPNIQELIWIDADGRELQVWVNNRARLMFNLIDWWFEQPTESGAVFTLTKTNRPNVLEFAWMDQPDPVVHINSQRMEELRTIGEQAEDMTTLDILMKVMEHWPKGADYLTILAEVNVVRRSSRRLVASLLSSYQCFYQRSGSPVWHYDPKKVDLGFDKTKKKFIKK